MLDVIVTSAVVSVGPTLVGLAAFLQARGANRAVNHAMPGEQTLAQNVVQMREHLLEARTDIVGVKEDVADVREQQALTLQLAGDAVVGIDGLRDRTTVIEEAMARAASLTAEVKHDLSQFNEIDQLGAEGRIERRHEDQADLTGRLDAIHDELRTLNDLTVGQMADAGETRRIEAIPEGDRTEAEQHHVEATGDDDDTTP